VERRGVVGRLGGRKVALDRMTENLGAQLLAAFRTGRRFQLVGRADGAALVEEAAATGKAFAFGEADYSCSWSPSTTSKTRWRPRPSRPSVPRLTSRTLRLAAISSVYEVKTGAVLEVANLSVSRAAPEEQRGQVTGDTRDALLRELVQELAEKTARYVSDVVYPARIVARTNDAVTLNRGDGTGIAPGQLWEVFALGTEMKDPDTGASLGRGGSPCREDPGDAGDGQDLAGARRGGSRHRAWRAGSAGGAVSGVDPSFAVPHPHPHRRRWKASCRAAGAVALLITLAGCQTYTAETASRDSDLRRGSLDSAVRRADADALRHDGGKDAVLYRLEQGAISRQAALAGLPTPPAASADRSVGVGPSPASPESGSPAPLRQGAAHLRASVVAFDRAEAHINAFDRGPEIRLGASSLALLTNLANQPYEGRDYDRILLHAYQALNYLQLGERDAARVELNRALQRQRDALARNAARLAGAEAAAAELRSGRVTDREGNRAVYDITRTSGDADAQRRLASIAASAATRIRPYGDYVNPFVVFLDGLFFLTQAEDRSTWSGPGSLSNGSRRSRPTIPTLPRTPPRPGLRRRGPCPPASLMSSTRPAARRSARKSA
jgi:hypothetical protein